MILRQSVFQILNYGLRSWVAGVMRNTPLPDQFQFPNFKNLNLSIDELF
jgi:hypothetical protein